MDFEKLVELYLFWPKGHLHIRRYSDAMLVFYVLTKPAELISLTKEVIKTNFSLTTIYNLPATKPKGCTKTYIDLNHIDFKFTMLKKLLILSVVFLSAASGYAQQFKALLYTKTAGFHHVSIHEGVAGVRNLGLRHNFSVDWQENADVFNEKSLKNYDVVIFLNTTGDILNDTQQAAFEKYIQSGKGWVGIHAAADTEYDWAWYTKLVGMMFNTHPAQQTAYLDVVNSNFPGLERFPKRMIWTDEWYEYQKPYKANDLKILINLDEKTYDPKTSKGTGMGAEHPMAWYHNYDGGRAFYTGLGHIGLVYSDQSFLDHLYGGIFWAATGKGIK